MNACSVWDFRSNEADCSQEEIQSFLRVLSKKYVFQLEQGESGYRHWQGRFSLIKKKRKPDLLKLFKANDFPVFNYLEPTCNPEYQKGDAFYQQKEDTRLEGPWKDTDEQRYIPKQIRNKELYPWQAEVIKQSKEFNDRTVNVIYDETGNIGKSFLASWCELFMNGVDLPPVNDAKDLMAVMCDICYDRLREPNPVFIDLPRSQDQTKIYGIYSAVEQIKKGKLYDLRYKYKSWWIDSPAIWCFTNTMPDPQALSRDRWIYWQVKDLQLVRLNPENFFLKYSTAESNGVKNLQVKEEELCEAQL